LVLEEEDGRHEAPQGPTDGNGADLRTAGIGEAKQTRRLEEIPKTLRKNFRPLKAESRKATEETEQKSRRWNRAGQGLLQMAVAEPIVARGSDGVGLINYSEERLGRKADLRKTARNYRGGGGSVAGGARAGGFCGLPHSWEGRGDCLFEGAAVVTSRVLCRQGSQRGGTARRQCGIGERLASLPDAPGPACEGQSPAHPGRVIGEGIYRGRRV
jgi:hypothetical protein